MEFTKVAVLKGRIRGYYGGYKDVDAFDIPLSDSSTWWKD